MLIFQFFQTGSSQAYFFTFEPEWQWPDGVVFCNDSYYISYAGFVKVKEFKSILGHIRTCFPNPKSDPSVMKVYPF